MAKATLAPRACVRCRTQFWPAKGNHILCSAACRRAGENARALNGRRAASTAKPAQPCVSCGTLFVPVTAQSIRCSRKCSARDFARKVAARRTTHGRPMVEHRCVSCDVVFAGPTGIRKYCSVDCRKKRVRPKPKSTAARRALARRGGVLPPSMACHRCGQQFKPFSVVSRWCSKRCRSKARTAQRSHRRAIRRRAIYDRDGGMCQLCGLPVDLAIPYPDPKAFTIDHRIPVTAGGGDEESNLQTAHMDCNAGKGGVTRWMVLL